MSLLWIDPPTLSPQKLVPMLLLPQNWPQYRTPATTRKWTVNSTITLRQDATMKLWVTHTHVESCHTPSMQLLQQYLVPYQEQSSEQAQTTTTSSRLLHSPSTHTFIYLSCQPMFLPQQAPQSPLSPPPPPPPHVLPVSLSWAVT